MASITNQPGGKRMIQIVLQDGRRTSIRLGKVSQRHAELIKHHIEDLASAQRVGQPPEPHTKHWVQSIDDKLRKSLERCGLIDEGTVVSLGDLIDAYLERRTDLKPKSRAYLSNASDKLIAYFGREKLIHTISPAEAMDWRRWILDQGLSEATARTYARGAKQIFKDAVERHNLQTNPFAKLPTGSLSNTNDRFLTHDEMTAIMDHCPDLAWRTLIALCRFGGLRCPSETHLITWADIDFEARTMTVWSPKTEHHIGHESRLTPIQPSLFTELQRLRDESPLPADAPVIPLSRHNLHRKLATITRNAGITPWNDPFHCLRRSCQTEWAQTYPEYAVAAWMGNSTVVARRHYLKVPESLITQATRQGLEGEKAMQKAMQYPPELPRIASQHRNRQK